MLLRRLPSHQPTLSAPISIYEMGSSDTISTVMDERARQHYCIPLAPGAAFQFIALLYVDRVLRTIRLETHNFKTEW
jgi:hypothetical protein